MSLPEDGPVVGGSDDQVCPACGARSMGVALPNAERAVSAERARLREKVVALRKGAVADRIRAFDMEWTMDHAKLSERCDTLAEVLALLAEREEPRDD